MHLGTIDTGRDLAHTWGFHELWAMRREANPDPDDEEEPQV